jgi:SAM-dependent methyltransferase
VRYADDLAYVHHTGFADLARGAAKFLVESVSVSGAVVDLGCGSGIVLRALIDSGRDVVGVDLSKSMLAIAKRTAPEAKLVRDSLYDAKLPRSCAGVFAVGEPLNYVEPDGRAPSVLPLFRKVANALSSGGVFIFDVIVAKPGPLLTRRGWSAGEDWACLVDTREDASRKHLVRDVTSFVKHGAHYVRSREVHHVRVFETKKIVDDLRAAGFARVRVTTSYGAHPLAIRRRAFIARCP